MDENFYFSGSVATITLSSKFGYSNKLDERLKANMWDIISLLGTSNKSINSQIQVPKLFFETRRRPKLMFGRLFCSTLPLKYRFGAFF
ncbi:MAG: hypothetical protein IJX33_03575, partial [Akkermansia sp.]|nr:hypothetical protein [Akkermansia sp.]